MVTDAPYGVQKGTAGRQDSIGGTIAAALPGWHSVLKPGGVLAISFNTHVTKRDALIRLMEKAGFEAVQTANLEQYAANDVRDVWKHVGAVEASTSSTQIDPIPTP